MQMTQQTDIFAERLAEIAKERERLDLEASLLHGLRAKLKSWPQLLKEGDKFSSRNAAKFELLAFVAEYLGEPDPLLFGGAGTHEIYSAVLKRAAKEKEWIEVYNRDPERLEKGKERDLGTPLLNRETPFNYNTFRSYLTRFKDEGRLHYNPETKKWRILKQDYGRASSPEDKEGAEE